LNIIHCIHVLNDHKGPINMYNYCVN
jgi:hypothetical protein